MSFYLVNKNSWIGAARLESEWRAEEDDVMLFVYAEERSYFWLTTWSRTSILSHQHGRWKRLSIEWKHNSKTSPGLDGWMMSCHQHTTPHNRRHNKSFWRTKTRIMCNFLNNIIIMSNPISEEEVECLMPWQKWNLIKSLVRLLCIYEYKYEYNLMWQFSNRFNQRLSQLATHHIGDVPFQHRQRHSDKYTYTVQQHEHCRPRPDQTRHPKCLTTCMWIN